MLLSPPPVLEIYYAPSCAPCKLDLPVAAAVLDHNAALRIVIVSENAKAIKDLQAVSPALAKTAEAAPIQDPRKTLRQAGDPDGILPYARSLANGRVCTTWRGRLSLAKALEMLAACGRTISRPKHRS